MIEDPAQWPGLQLNLGKDELRAAFDYVNNRGLLVQNQITRHHRWSFASNDTSQIHLQKMNDF